MRKFIMGEPHGFGNVYYSMMAYLDNISEQEGIEVYINGDLIDRGYESAEILLDVKKRVLDNKYKIEYLGGNHELLMHKEYRKRKKGKPFTPFNNWYDSGGMITDDMLWELLNYDESKVMEVVDFVNNLKIYHKFPEKINNKPIVLVHAACPKTVKDECTMLIKDNDKIVT